MQSFSMLIDGRLVATPEQDAVINPAQAAPFATCARASKAHVDAAVAAAARAYPAWRRDEALRRQKLNECAAALQARATDIAQLLTQEQGKPLGNSMMEIYGASMWFSYFAGLEVEPEVLQDDAEKRIQIVHKPLGVVAAITPWNFPIVLLAWKLAPALLAGNTVVAQAVRVHAAQLAAASPTSSRTSCRPACSTCSPVRAPSARSSPAIRRCARSRSPAASRPARRSCSTRPAT